MEDFTNGARSLPAPASVWRRSIMTGCAIDVARLPTGERALSITTPTGELLLLPVDGILAATLARNLTARTDVAS